MQFDDAALTSERTAKLLRAMSSSSNDGEEFNGFVQPEVLQIHRPPQSPAAEENVGETNNNTKKRAASDQLDMPRRRITTACDTCRQRKSRCDGQKPKCRLCIETRAPECVYRPASTKLDAGDKLIIEHLTRIEKLLENNLPMPPVPGALFAYHHSPPAPSPGSSENRSPEFFTSEARQRRASSAGLVDMIRFTGLGTSSTESGPNISTMPKEHTTPAFHLLQWPKVRDLVANYDMQALLDVEVHREGLQTTPSWPVDMTNAQYFAGMFFDRVNKWYACVNPYRWKTYYENARSRRFQSGADSCVVLLVIALGMAATSTSITACPVGTRPPGWNHFSCAWALLPNQLAKNDILAAQSYLLSAAYLFYIVRPLEAWTLLTNAGIKVQLLIRTLLSPHDVELCQRVYWNALLFESDLLAELHLPHSGLVHLEEHIQLPRGFTFTDLEKSEKAGEDDLWYFLAEINLRRLLNRVSNLCYTTTSPGPGVPPGFDSICQELDAQLIQWHENLPTPVKFPHGAALPSDPVQTVLRLRFFACRTIIYRPYILVVLQDESQSRVGNVLENCRKCLESCMRQLENLEAHHSGHLPYLWQGALSMMSQTLLVMSATMSPSMTSLLPDKNTVATIISNVIKELQRYAHLSPSLRLSAEILKGAEERRKALLEHGPEALHKEGAIAALTATLRTS